MILKALILALPMLFGGVGMLQVSVWLESYALLSLGVALTGLGVLHLARQPDRVIG